MNVLVFQQQQQLLIETPSLASKEEAASPFFPHSSCSVDEGSARSFVRSFVRRVFYVHVHVTEIHNRIHTFSLLKRKKVGREVVGIHNSCQPKLCDLLIAFLCWRTIFFIIMKMKQ